MTYGEGTLYLAGTSQSIAVKLRFCSDNSLEIVNADSGESISRTSKDEMRIESKLGSSPREMVLPGNDLLSVQATDETDKWIYNESNSKISRLESNRKLVLSSVILTPLALLSIFKYLIPFLAIQFAAIVPYAVTELASEHTLLSLDNTVLSPSKLSDEQQAIMVSSWEELTGKIVTENPNYHFGLRNSEFFGPNAFALPNGQIIVTDQLVELFESDSDLLNAVVLHEIGHVENHHSMRLIAETLAASLAIDYLIGDLGGMIEFFGGMSNTIIQNKFSQELEWEADDFAIAQMHHLGLSADDFASAMEKLSEKMPQENEVSNLLSSHPMTQARIENARQKAKQD